MVLEIIAESLATHLTGAVPRDSIPPQVIIVYGTTKRAYGRARLLRLTYQEALQLIYQDFRIPRYHSLYSALSVTFHGHDRGTVSVDYVSWNELLHNVVRVDVAKPKRLDWRVHLHNILIIYGAWCLLSILF